MRHEEYSHIARILHRRLSPAYIHRPHYYRFRYRSIMTSPPTPSRLAPAQRSQWRFCPVTVPTEWVEDYRPSKFHPVHLGDLFKDGRYRVIRKLGYGAYSTVWLARDEQYDLNSFPNSVAHLFLCYHRLSMAQASHHIPKLANIYRRIGCYVALKILTAQSTVLEIELSILKTMAQSTLPHRGKKHVITLQDYFKHRGPNGEHGSLVFEVMAPSTASMVECLPKPLISKMGQEDRYPIWMSKSILQEALLGIDFLHQSGISHGDLQPGNLLFSVADMKSVDEIRLLQQEIHPTSLQPIESQDGKVGLWAPKYLAVNQPLTEFVS